MTIHHDDCGHIKSHWDNYKKCINGSHCSRESTCSTCSSWSNSVWELAEKRRTYSSRKRVLTNRKKSLDVSVSSDERKENMGTLPLMALLPRVRPVLVATPWVLVPKGVQVHRPMASSHRASGNRPATDYSPSGQEDISG